MDPQMIEKVTKLVLSKIQDSEVTQPSDREEVKIWNHTSSSPDVQQIESKVSNSRDQMSGRVKFSSYVPTLEKANQNHNQKVKKSDQHQSFRKPDVKMDNSEDELKELKSKTPARIGVGRAGVRPKTDTWLKFRYDHAAAVDAVFGDVDSNLLKALDLFTVNTKVTDKETFIRRPDYGRRLSDEGKRLIRDKCQHSPQVQVIVSNGLSSKAIDENLEDVYLSLMQSLKSLGLEVGTPFFIEKGRVAVMDDVGEQLKPEVAVLLVGERPGLVSAESLSAYLCYKPNLETIESDRMVISNIHAGGIPPVEAGAYLGTVIEKILKYEASGVSLVKKEG